MPSIARTSTEFSDDRVEDEQFHDHRSDDFDNSSSSSSNSLAEDARETGPGIRSLDTDEHSDSRGPRVPETERNEHRPSTTGEREGQYFEDDSQSSESTEESDNGSDDGATLIGDVGNGNHPGRYAEHRRLSVVEVSFEFVLTLDMPTPALTVGNDEDDSHSEFATNYDSDEEEGPVAIEHAEGGAPHVSVMGVVVPANNTQRRKRTRAALEDDDGDVARHRPMAESMADDALRMLASVAADAPRAPKRAHYAETTTDPAEQYNLAFALHESCFGEPVRRPLRVRIECAYASGSGSEVRLDLEHASLLGAPTLAPSPTSWRRPTVDHTDEEDEYKNEEEDAEEEDYVEEHEDKGEEHAGEEEENEEERDDQRATRFPVTVVERHHEDEVHTNDDI